MASQKDNKIPMEPQERMKYLTKFGNVVQVDSNVPLKRYARGAKSNLYEA